ncbi:MAG: hypothetical protein JWR09_191 [Mucilaginibacter sp.]|nr:hypothetical protein [Mucilaginibacter sp.]
MELTLIQKLDIVLFYFNDLGSGNYKFIHELEKEIKDISSSELQAILNQLAENRFIEDLPHNYESSPSAAFGSHPKTIRKYSITFQGMLFCQINRGYEMDQIAKDAENTRLSMLETETTTNRTLTTRLTILVAVGTGIAAIYYLYLLWQELCWCQFVWQKH